MATKREFFFPSSDGVHQIHGTEWRPEGKPRAVLQIVHGIAEYINRYETFAQFLAEQGFAVVGSDHLGHGKSAGSPADFGFIAKENGWRYLVSDVRALRVAAGNTFAGTPYFMLGHSMGSFLARSYLIRWPDTLSGCILSGTGQEPAPTVALGKALSGLMCRFGRAQRVSKLLTAMSLGAYNNQFKPSRTRADWISRDEAVVDAYVADEFCSFVPTVGMFHDMMGGLQFISNPSELRKMDPHTPLYFFSGDADPVGASGAGVRKVCALFRGVGCEHLSLKLYPEGRHEMLNETNRQEVYADVLAWLNAQLPANL